jgi:dCTP deaminase
MSILLKDEILNEYQNGNIHIEPYNISQLGPNSYDVKLGNTLKIYNNVMDNGEMILDVKTNNNTMTIDIPEEGLVLRPGTLYLGTTVEAVGSDHYVPMYEGRSSMARLGIQSHISAGFGDVGFKSKWTLEIIVIHPVRIYAGMKIGQIYFHTINQASNIKTNRYNGKYKYQNDPQQSKSYLDFDIHEKNYELYTIGC